MMTLDWPQIVYLAMTFIGIGAVAAWHGKPRDGKHNFWLSSAITALTIFILYMGGFFG